VARAWLRRKLSKGIFLARVIEKRKFTIDVTESDIPLDIKAMTIKTREAIVQYICTKTSDKAQVAQEFIARNVSEFLP